MKAVLISIQPKWVEKIASGEKTIEVRKTRPKIDTPFKCYIYCTKGKDLLREVNCYNTRTGIHKTNYKIINLDYCTNKIANGKVIGEFVCDRIEDFYCASVPYKKENNLGYGRFVDNGVYKVNGWHEGIVFERNDRFIDSMLNNNDLKEMCLSAQELFDYIGVGTHLYAWHITDLKIYDKPKELSEFGPPILCSVHDKVPTKQELDIDLMIELPSPQYHKSFFCKKCKYYNGDFGTCDRGYKLKPITRAPQSWCYVEVEE